MNQLLKPLFYLSIFLSFLPASSYVLDAEEPICVTDTYEYRKFCLDATADELIFQNFKLYPVYQQFYENVSYGLGLTYLKMIKEKYTCLLNYVTAFQENDFIGNPNTYSYDIGEFSPSTLRYIKVAGDLLSQFPDLSSMKIIEIGSGYGGQCKILSDLGAFQEYTIVDLPEALALTKKYLDILNVKNVTYLTPEEMQESNYDLVISNYGFSKCSHALQTEYLNKILKKSSFGYMTLDFPVLPFKEKTFTVPELISEMIKDPLVNVRIYPEEPLTSPKNVIFIWRKK